MFTGLELLQDNFPNKELEEKIRKFRRRNNDKNYKELIIELEKSAFLFPVLSKDYNIEGFVLNQVKDKRYVSIFSSMIEFNKWYQDYELNFLFYSINEVCRIIIDENNDCIDGFIIDPCGLNMIFDKELIKKRFSE
jgi:hypothetical protein